MAESSSSGLTFKLHPLVILNISDHFTRVRSQSLPLNNGAGCCGGSSSGNGDVAAASASAVAVPRVYGCVIGSQRGRTVEIFNSFELLFDSATNSLDRAFLEKKQELYKKVFPNFYILGWYSTGTEAQESDMLVHRAIKASGVRFPALHSIANQQHITDSVKELVKSVIGIRESNCHSSQKISRVAVSMADLHLMDINESPVYVLLNPAINPAQKDLPVSIYESELHVIDGLPQLIFVRSSYNIETVEAERISVDHVAHLKPSDGGSAATQLAAHLTGMHSAIKMLNSRIRVLHQYLLAMEKGEIPCENALMRQVSSLVRRLPAIESSKFQDDFLMEYNDTLLVTYLAMLTNSSSAMNELVDKFNTAFDRHSRRGGRNFL